MSTVLIVDDMEQNRKLFRIILEGEFPGCTVLEAENGAIGVEQARLNKPDLVLMDIRMPEMDGLTATRRLKGDPDTAAIPVVIVTSSMDSRAGNKIVDSGCDDQIGKPFQFADFVSRVRRFLGDQDE